MLIEKNNESAPSRELEKGVDVRKLCRVGLRANDGDKAAPVRTQRVRAAASTLKVVVTSHAVDDNIDGATIESICEIKVGPSIVQEYDVGAKVLHELSVGGTAVARDRCEDEKHKRRTCKLQ